MASSVQLILAVLTLVLSCFGAARAQIMELRDVGGKSITCMHSGISSDLNARSLPNNGS
jgi:hypothetical protein